MWHLFILLLLSVWLSVSQPVYAQALSTPQELQPVLHLLTEHSPPGEYLNEQGKLAGVTYQLLREIATELQEPVKFQLLPWARAFSLATSQPSTAIFETTRTAVREPLFQWVGPLKIHHISLYAREDRYNPDIPSVFWPKHYTACEYNKSAYLEQLANWGFIEEPQLYKTTQQGDCFAMLMRERVDFILLSETSYALRQAELSAANISLIKVADIAMASQFLAFSLDVPTQRVARWQKALLQSYADGRMRRLYQGVYPDAMLDALEQLALTQLATEASDVP